MTSTRSNQFPATPLRFYSRISIPEATNAAWTPVAPVHYPRRFLSWGGGCVEEGPAEFGAFAQTSIGGQSPGPTLIEVSTSLPDLGVSPTRSVSALIARSVGSR